MKKLTSFFKQHKKLSVFLGTLLVLVAAAAVGIGMFEIQHQHDDSPMNLVDRMADLVNEPSSPQDERYLPNGEDGTVRYRIRVNKSRNCITVYQKGSDGKYSEPVRAMVCSVGYNAPLGEYKTSDRYTWKIVNGNVWSQYATRIMGNVLFHSVTYQQKSPDSLISKYYNQLGMTASAGCIRLMVSDAKWLMEHCVPGTAVEIYESEDPGPLGKPGSLIVAEDEKWDPSDPNPANPWLGHEPSITGVADRTVERGIGVNYLEGVAAMDTIGNDVTNQIQIKTELDYKKVGTYKVTYSLTDGLGKVITKDVNFTVADTKPPCFSGIKKQIMAQLGEQITTAKLLENVFVVDNNELLSKDVIKITIPEPLQEGVNTITYTVTDAYGNVGTATTEVIVDNKPPVISLREGAGNILEPYQIMDQTYALARVTATDAGKELAANQIQVVINQIDWGYQLIYTATDNSGQSTVFTDQVMYPTFTVEIDGDLYDSDLSNGSLMKGVTVKDQSGNLVEGASVSINTLSLGSGKYYVTYSYMYNSILGSKTATKQRYVYMSNTTDPNEGGNNGGNNSDTPSVTEQPTPTPEPTEGPQDNSSGGWMDNWFN